MTNAGKQIAAGIFALACLSGSASAEPWGAPTTYVMPMPPVMEPTFEVGVRMWVSQGKTDFNFTSAKIAPELGNPTSVLTYDDMDGISPEVTFRARNLTKFFFKGFFGGGWLDGGNLDDEDYLAGQIKFSDTFSRVKDKSLVYGTVDIGRSFTFSGSRVTIGPLVGFNFYQETAEAYGVRCNKDNVGGDFCGAPGDVVVPYSTKVIRNEANWVSLRLGTEIKARLSDRFTLIGDAAILPVSYVWNYDSHYLRTDLGTIPNIEDRGTGWGYQLEAEARYDFTENWSAGAGVRYWHLEANDGTTEFVNSFTKVKLNEFESERFGVFGDLTYRFSTF